MELETTARVPVERLRLDRGNPRLVGEATVTSDEWIIARLYQSAELDELRGDRRLAALRLLRGPALVR
ncbi:MAG: hypothetical protein F4061_09385 [Acidobacteria bacterium]|nr:hypothetical protein [Acidobacteriota bacterium]